MARRSGKPRVLVVEDDHATRQLLRDLLESEGFEVAAAMTLAQANRLLEERFEPHVVVLDHTLPDGLGAEFCASLKAASGGAPPPCLLISAVRRLDLVASAAHADRWLEKPFDLDELVQIVASLARLGDRAVA